MINIFDSEDVRVWHTGEPLPAREDIRGPVIVITADGDELEWLLSQMGVRRRMPPASEPHEVAVETDCRVAELRLRLIHIQANCDRATVVFREASAALESLDSRVNSTDSGTGPDTKEKL